MRYASPHVSALQVVRKKKADSRRARLLALGAELLSGHRARQLAVVVRRGRRQRLDELLRAPKEYEADRYAARRGYSRGLAVLPKRID